MRALIQRVKSAQVIIAEKIVAEIGEGFLVLLGIKVGDTEKDADYLVEKVMKLRVFDDDEGRPNLSILNKNYAILVVSQFTLYADCKKGARPSFSEAMPQNEAKILYNKFMEKLKVYNLKIGEGIFGEYMQVALVNDGPVTILIDSEKVRSEK